MHDICVETHTVAWLREILTRPNSGVVDTGLVDGWQLIRKLLPNTKVAVIRRPMCDVLESLRKFGVGDWCFEYRDKCLDMVSALPGVLTVNYEDLDDEKTIRALWEHCLEMPFDVAWWKSFKDVNLQIDMAERLTRLALNLPGLQALKAEVARMAA